MKTFIVLISLFFIGCTQKVSPVVTRDVPVGSENLVNELDIKHREVVYLNATPQEDPETNKMVRVYVVICGKDVTVGECMEAGTSRCNKKDAEYNAVENKASFSSKYNHAKFLVICQEPK